MSATRTVVMMINCNRNRTLPPAGPSLKSPVRTLKVRDRTPAVKDLASQPCVRRESSATFLRSTYVRQGQGTDREHENAVPRGWTLASVPLGPGLNDLYII